jgi:peptidoglycan/LPS O-acetylase OafA/YrhL
MKYSETIRQTKNQIQKKEAYIYVAFAIVYFVFFGVKNNSEFNPLPLCMLIGVVLMILLIYLHNEKKKKLTCPSCSQYLGKDIGKHCKDCGFNFENTEEKNKLS